MAAVVGRDGAVDTVAWETLVQEEQAAFMQEESSREAQVSDSDKFVVRKPEDQPFVISAETERELARNLGYKAFFMIAGGIAVSALGTWLALMHGFSREWTAAFVVGGFVGGMVLARTLRNRRTGRVSWNS
jgi:hypothetical protein